MTFKEFMASVKYKTEETAQLAKLKSRIAKEKSDIKKMYTEIGEMVYKKYSEGGTVDIDYIDKLDEINSCKKHIQELNQAITELKMD